MPCLEGCKVLITGGSGFLGSHLWRRLVKLGAEVHATSRFEHAPEREGPTWWRTDLSSVHHIRKLLTDLKPTVVYHLAGAAGGQARPGIDSTDD